MRAPLLRSGPVLVVALVALVVASCDDGNDDALTTAETFATVAVTEPLFTPAGGEVEVADSEPTLPVTDDPDSAQSSTSAETDPSEPIGTVDATVPPTVPDTGVPGVDSEDDFCRAWSRFAGSFQALAASWAFEEPAAAARLEVVASPTVDASASSLEADLPAELESERAEVAAFVGPLARRAADATAELGAAGLSDDAIADLADAWLDALATAPVDETELDVVLPDSVDDAAVQTATDAFAAATPSMLEDPSMITEASIPLTEEYLASTCPDQGTLAGNDDVGSP